VFVTRLTRDQSDLPVSPLSCRSDRGQINSVCLQALLQITELLQPINPLLLQLLAASATLVTKHKRTVGVHHEVELDSIQDSVDNRCSSVARTTVTLCEKIILMCLLLLTELCLVVAHQNQQGKRLHGVAANPLVLFRETFLPARLSHGSCAEIHVEDAMGLGVFPSSLQTLD
jgi:hypothetical protein